MIVATVLRSGSFYGEPYVQALKAAVEHHAPEARFIVLADVDLPDTEVSPLETDLPGWWAKMELIRPGSLPDDELVMSLDLDTLVRGPLSWAESYRGNWAMISDFYRPEFAQSGVMLFRPGKRTAALWEMFWKEHEAAVDCWRGDGEWLASHSRPDRLQDLFPRRIASFKPESPRRASKGPPAGVSIVCAHGEPRLHTFEAGWAHREWAMWRTRSGVVASERPDIAGRVVFVVGGGPSVGRVDLAAEREANPDAVWVALNDSLRRMPWADIVFSADMSWVQRRAGEIVASGVPCVFAAPHGYVLDYEIPGAEFVLRVQEDGNTGLEAALWAVDQGAAEVVLLGFDMNQPGHWHDGYEWGTRLVERYPMWIAQMDDWAKRWERMGASVVNANLDSGVRCLPFRKLASIRRKTGAVA